jgi:arylsulfatase A-like enzyme
MNADAPTSTRRSPVTLRSTTRSALTAGATCGTLFGTLDAIAAAIQGTATLGVGTFLGCLGASVLLYSTLFMVALASLGAALHFALRRCRLEEEKSHGLFLALGVTCGAFAESFWWSRAYLFYGHPVFSTERLLASAGLLLAAVAIGWLVANLALRFSRGVRRGVAIYLVLSCLIGAAFLGLEGRASGERGAINERNHDQPNLLLVVVDALRQDTLGCYGHPIVKSPNIDRLAADGVLFENHLTQVPFTWPSFGSLLTGKYPRRHGLIKMEPGLRMPPNVTLPWHLKTGERTDGRAMQDGDWIAATFHTGTLSTGSGLLRGFDQYYEAMAGHELVTLDSTWSVFRSDLLLFLIQSKLSQKLDRGGVVPGARDWISNHAHQHFATMVHLYSTHTPYDPSAAERALYCDPAYTGPVNSFYAAGREAIEQGKYRPSAADVRRIRSLYYGGVTDADAAIGSLVEELARQGVLDDTLVVVTSDHGESLGEAQGTTTLWEHDHMVQTNLRIPLVMRWPKALPRGQRVSARTDEIDVFPTICDLMHLRLPSEPAPLGIVDGKSLLPLVRGEAQSQRPVSFAENALFRAAQGDRWKLVIDAKAVQVGDWKAVRELPSLLEPRLFDLSTDPGEQVNVLDAHEAEAAQLYQALHEWSQALPVRRMESSARDLDQVQRFHQLGYTGGNEGPRNVGETPK